MKKLSMELSGLPTTYGTAPLKPSAPIRNSLHYWFNALDSSLMLNLKIPPTTSPILIYLGRAD